jgi:hypothetical protein
MLKRNIIVLALAGGLLGAQAALANGHQADSSEESSGFRDYLDGRIVSEINVVSAYSDALRERGDGDSSPFPLDTSRD